MPDQFHAHSPAQADTPVKALVPDASTAQDTAISLSEAPSLWTDEAERELKKVPFFVRGKARRNTETFAADNGIHPITVETLYDAKAHFAR